MKKLVSLFVFILAFSFNTNAQGLKTAEELGKQDAQAVAKYLEISGQVVTDLQGLFTMKHETLLMEGISADRKKVLAEIVEAKLVATLDPTDIEKLKLEPEMYKKLIGK